MIVKALERIVAERIMYHFESFDILDPCQSAYLQERSFDSDSFDSMLDDVWLAADRRMVTMTVFFDFTKAFNRVDHWPQPWLTSWGFGFLHSSLLWLSSANLNGRENVRDPCMKETSRKRTILSKVSQGFVLGSLLFVLYLKDFSSVLKHCRYNFYANDLLMYLHLNPKQLGNAILKVNEDITNIT